MVNRNLRSIDSKRAAQLLERITQQQFENPNSLFVNKSTISAFGQYQIQKKKNYCIVFKRGVQIAEFGSLRSALSYCVADKYNILSLKNNIYDIDQELSRKESDILFYQHTLKESNDIELKNIVFSRLVECKSRVIWLRKRLNKCINSAKYWQQKGFDNETSRFGIQKPNSNFTKGF